MTKILRIAQNVQTWFQRLALVLFAAFAVFMVVTCVMAAFGALSWLDMTMTWQGTPVENAGMMVQIGATVLAVSLCFFLPTNARVLALESSHRTFSVDMQDVARAYQAVHAGDRAGVFEFKSEFETMRDRLAYLTQHPDLGDLEPPVLELAAQMSFMSKELAEVYNDSDVDRARAFLEQRQQEVTRFEKRLTHAKVISDELKHWLHDIESEERIAAVKLERLCEELMETLPELGMDTPHDPDPKLVDLTSRRGAPH